MYPNEKIQGPFGDVFQIGTPYLDKLSDRLYAEQQRRQLQQERDAKVLDDEFARNMANIRDADIPDLAKAYGNWKLANQQLIKRKSASPEEQLDVLRKKAEMYNIISKSKAQREQEKLYGTDIVKKPANYNDDAHLGLVNIMRTPVLKFGDQDPLSSLVYTGDKYKKAAEDLKAALGTKRSVTDNGTPLDDKGIQTKYTKYNVLGVNPEQIRDFYLGRMADREANKHYTYELKNLPEDELVKTNEAFQSIPDAQWELMGIKKPNLNYDRLDDDAHLLATYKAQKAVLQNLPARIGEEIKTNAKAKADYDFQNRLKALGASDAYIKNRMKLAEGYKRALIQFKNSEDANSREQVLNKFIDNMFEAGKATPDASNDKFKGGKFVQVPKDISDKYTINVGTNDAPIWEQPKSFYLSKDKKTIRVLFPKKDEKGEIIIDGNGEYELDSEKSKTIPIQNFKVDLSKLLLTKSKTGSEVVDEFSGDSTPRETESFTISTVEKNPPKTVSASTIKSLVGKKGYEGYTEKELMDYYKSQGYIIK